MIPYILTAVGGYLIGSSLRTKFANGGDIEYKKSMSRYDMLGELYEDASPEERKQIQKEMDELESKMHKYERNYANGGDVDETGIKLYGTPREIIKELKSRKNDNAIHAEIFQSYGYIVFVYDNIGILIDKKFKTHEEAKQYLDYWISQNGKSNQSKYDYGTIQDIAEFPYRQNISGTLPKDFIEKHSAKKFANGGEVANTILSQLGGARRLNIMTGAYNFVDLGSGVSFKLKNPRANYVKIQLNSMDLYDIEVGRIRGTDYKVVDSANNLYFDQLKPFIEKATGLYLSL